MAEMGNNTERIEQRNIQELGEYAYKLFKGEGISKDVKEAYRLFHIAADQGDANAMFWLGAICENEDECKSPQEGFEWFLKAAKTGYIPAQYQIGYHYLHGVYVKQDYLHAFKWFMISAVRGYPNSQNSVGTMYLRGQVKFDEWLERNNHIENETAYNQEECQRSGHRWLMKSAKQNHPSGLYNLAGMYLYGVYVEKDEDIAISMYRLADKLGGTGTRAADMLDKLGVDHVIREEDYERLENLFESFDDDVDATKDESQEDIIEYIFRTQNIIKPELTDDDEIRVIGLMSDKYKKDQFKYLLFNREAICKYQNEEIFLRDINKHTWEYDHLYTCDYLYEHDSLVEDIDYDENTEEILALRRKSGVWACEDAIEIFKPSPQVIRFLEKTGLTYVDIYGDYGKKGAKQSEPDNFFDIYPDLLEGAPGRRPDEL